jgi:hypothetical protein
LGGAGRGWAGQPGEAAASSRHRLFCAFINASVYSGVSYGSMTVIFVVFLSEEFGFADEDAGMLYGRV